MTTENVIKIRQRIAELGNPAFRIRMNNVFYIFGNTEDSAPILWDDENERFIEYRANVDWYNQGDSPILSVYYPYDLIESIEIALNTKSALKDLEMNKSLIASEEDKKKITDLFKRVSSTRQRVDLYGHTGPNYANTPYYKK